MTRAVGLTPEILAELTISHTDKEIGEMYGVGSRAIERRRRRNGIKPGSRRTFDPPRAELHALYQKMSMRDIAKHYGIGDTAVWNRIKEHGIVNESQPERGHRFKPGHKHSPEHLEAIRAAGKKRRGKYVGPNNPHWKGGISGASRHGRSKAAHRDWKYAVLDRAGNRCEGCGAINGHHCACCNQSVRLHVHHIKHYRDHPELRYKVSNGRALCATCHYQEHFCKTA